jgi:hypothetical protein
MKHLIIKNVGPISYADIDLNKVNVIMGPQSSGKSTIAKIISYCQWLEKSFLSEGYTSGVYEITDFLQYHKINKEYLSENSLIMYHNEVSIEFPVQNMFSVKTEDGIAPFAYQQRKIIYIPAERNFVAAVPDLARYKGKYGFDNTMGFINAWYDAKTPDRFNILNLDVSYYNESSTDADTDIVVIKTKTGDKKIELSTASSGLQSIIPLLLTLNYHSDTIYKTPHSLSVREKNHLKQLEEDLQKTGSYYDSEQLKKNRADYYFTQYIIEEPEQNLFPSTQRDLLYHIIQTILKREKDSITLTTHSPYILYALNNCMMGYLVKDSMPEEETGTLPSHNSWINPADVCVWEIENGKLRSVQDKDRIISANYFDQQLTELTDEYYQMLNYYEDGE